MTREFGKKLEVTFLVFPEFHLLDLSGPMTAFEIASGLAPRAYALHVMSTEGGPVASSAGPILQTEKIEDTTYDTFIVVGGAPCRDQRMRELADHVRQHGFRARRVGSVCSGAFLLGAAGLLDGRRATTHWQYARDLQRAVPHAKIDSEPLVLRDGSIWTSAGTDAGIDLALAMIEEDLGLAIARSVAQTMVVPRHRSGRQSQFSGFIELEAQHARIQKALDYAKANLCEKLSVDQLAEIACLSVRQFGRAFAEDVGMSPAKAVERMRVNSARLRLETGIEPIETIAAATGFGDPEKMRRAFLRWFGGSPQSVRRSLQHNPSFEERV